MLHIQSSTRTLLSDMRTPIGVYQQLRDHYPNSLLLESSDYPQQQNGLSYICLQPLATFKADHNTLCIQYEGQEPQRQQPMPDIVPALQDFIRSITVTGATDDAAQGLFGYTTYDAIPLYHPVSFRHSYPDVPLLQYQYFRFVLIFNHSNDTLRLIENIPEGSDSKAERLLRLLHHQPAHTNPFRCNPKRDSNYSDPDFLRLIEQGREHCYRGDVFQVVLSRQFSRQFTGDEFNVYRALRSVNPSPYLFYFNYGNFSLMGSSPEAQLRIQDQQAVLHPIAGTYRRTGDPVQDQKLAEALKQDPKENAEHVMLVDLARNDLSINSDSVQLTQYKSIEFYSHVMHMVSTVSAPLQNSEDTLNVFFNTFPAGTLSGAPKHKAMQIIDQLENQARGFYGGAIGIIGLNGSLHQAIFIRSLLCKDQSLYYQAGCGIVTQSVATEELQEVYHKLAAIETAIAQAQTLSLS